jgi:hypothetical protein
MTVLNAQILEAAAMRPEGSLLADRAAAGGVGALLSVRAELPLWLAELLSGADASPSIQYAQVRACAW